MTGAADLISVRVDVNGTIYERRVEARMLLSDFLRHELGLTGTHVGCEHGVCGVCTVLLEGDAVRSCLLFAAQVDGHRLRTVEGLALPERVDVPHPGRVDVPRPEAVDNLHPLQEAFRAHHGLQCGFCTPGILMTLIPFLEEHPDATEREIREALSGNLCRCTGYQNIVAAALAYLEDPAATGLREQ